MAITEVILAEMQVFLKYAQFKCKITCFQCIWTAMYIFFHFRKRKTRNSLVVGKIMHRITTNYTIPWNMFHLQTVEIKKINDVRRVIK